MGDIVHDEGNQLDGVQLNLQAKASELQCWGFIIGVGPT